MTNSVSVIYVSSWYLRLLLLFITIARNGSRILQSLAAEERATCIYTLADLLLSKEKEILEANSKDLEEATKGGLKKPLLSRLSLTSAKLKNLATGTSTHKSQQ